MVGRIVFVEGGGDRGVTRQECRKAFKALFERVNNKARNAKVVACGSRTRAYHSFVNALVELGAEAYLLVDSEEVVEDKFTGKPWAFLKAHDNWNKPSKATNEQAHLMAVVSETWTVADADNLTAYYGKGFEPKSLPKRPDLETVAKKAIQDGLAKATRRSAKGTYHKTGHGFDLMANFDPAKVRERCPTWAERFFSTVEGWE